MSVTLVTILMIGMFLTGFLMLWQNFNLNAVALNDAVRISSQLERERIRTSLHVGNVEVDTENCAIDLEIINSGQEAIAPITGFEVMVSFPGGSNVPRILEHEGGSEGSAVDTWSIKLADPSEAEPSIARPGSSHTIRMGLNLPEPSDTTAFVIVSTPNGVTVGADVTGILTPCSATE